MLQQLQQGTGAAIWVGLAGHDVIVWSQSCAGAEVPSAIP